MEKETVRILEMFRQGRIDENQTLSLLDALAEETEELEDAEDGTAAGIGGESVEQRCIAGEKDLYDDNCIKTDILNMIQAGEISAGEATAILPLLLGSDDREVSHRVFSMIKQGILGAGVAIALLPLLQTVHGRELRGKVLKEVEEGRMSGGTAIALLPGLISGHVHKEKAGCCQEDTDDNYTEASGCYENINIPSFSEYMEDVEAEKVCIAGVGKFDGCLETQSIQILGKGEFKGAVTSDRIEIVGEGLFGSDVEAESISSAGKAAFGGDVESDSISNAGEMTFDGDLGCGSLENSGTCDVNGDLQVDKLRNKGVCTINGDIEADSIVNDYKAFLKAQSDISTDTFVSRGSFEVKGSIEADSVDVIVNMNCKGKASDISAGTVKVKLKREEAEAGDSAIAGIDGPLFTCGSIEADSIELEYTSARQVSGVNIKIGKGCTIEAVEYSGKLFMDEESKVIREFKG